MKTDINNELFKRYAPKKKLEIIESLTQDELLRTTPDTIKRIVREAGTHIYKSRDKRLSIAVERQTGNNWNSTILGAEICKGKLIVLYDIEYSNTDTTDGVYFSEFMKGDTFRGTYTTTDRFGNPQTYYCLYYDADRANAIKSLLLEYVYKKYDDKLNFKQG